MRCTQKYEQYNINALTVQYGWNALWHDIWCVYMHMAQIVQVMINCVGIGEKQNNDKNESSISAIVYRLSAKATRTVFTKIQFELNILSRILMHSIWSFFSLLSNFLYFSLNFFFIQFLYVLHKSQNTSDITFLWIMPFSKKI